MLFPVLLAMLLASSVEAQQVGSIRGVVHDKDFDALLPGAEVQIVGGERVMTTDQGTFVFREVAPGTYTLVFSKEGYVRQVRTDVVVSAGKLTDLEVWLSGDFTEMEEFVVQNTQLGAGTETGLLELRFDSPSLLDSIGADLMSRAGASDAASALKLVAGASVQDGKYAVVRGLPDRYVSSQMNGVRLPTADEDKRAVELDQFPAPVIESIQVKKTFTPDQQGDASGGAVDLRLKSVPDVSIFQLKGEYGYNTQVTGRSDFLTYDGGGVNFWGRDGGRNIQGNHHRRQLDGSGRGLAGRRPRRLQVVAGHGWQARRRRRGQGRRLRQLLLRARQLVLRQRGRRLLLGREPRRSPDAADLPGSSHPGKRRLQDVAP